MKIKTRKIETRKIETLRYFEGVIRSSKAFIITILFWLFLVIQMVVKGYDPSLTDDLVLFLLSLAIIFCLFFLGYKQATKINKDNNFLYYPGTLTELMIFLNKCGFNLKEQIGDYYVMCTKFPLQYYKQIMVKSEGVECIIFGDIFLIKMLEIDLITLKQVCISIETCTERKK